MVTFGSFMHNIKPQIQCNVTPIFLKGDGAEFELAKKKFVATKH